MPCPGGDCADCGRRRCSKEESVQVVLPEELPTVYAMEHSSGKDSATWWDNA